MKIIYVKIIGSFLWVAAGFLISMQINKSKREYLRRIEAYIELIKFIRLKIECFVTPIPDILQECDDEILKLCCKGQSIPYSIEEIHKSIPRNDNSKGYRIIRDFFRSIGKSYKDSEIRLCNNSICALIEHKDEIEKRLPSEERARTALWLCSFCALLLIIL